jgi:hypothetical protein
MGSKILFAKKGAKKIWGPDLDGPPVASREVRGSSSQCKLDYALVSSRV